MPLTTEQREWLALKMVPGVGTTLFIRLLARFKTPGEVLRTAEHALSEVVGPKVAQRIRQYREIIDLPQQERLLEQYDASIITMDDGAYPERLAAIYDPPLVLFTRGQLLASDAYAVAIVGTRQPSPYGARMAETFGRELAARGITVVSGMAAGIDAAAHRGAIEAGGRTIAVLGNGVDILYPSENAELMHRIVQSGAAVSSFEMGVKPSKGHFPHRNRIISGMTMGTLVVEAPPSSGALITARFAAEQGHEVFALPGQVGQRNSLGPHALIREGAKLVETVEDILVELDLPASIRQRSAAAQIEPVAAIETEPRQSVSPPQKTPVARSNRTAAAERPASPPLAPAPQRGPAPVVSGTEKEVLSVLSADGSFVDEIALACRISISEALSSLTMLEIKGLVRQFSGKRFAPR